MINENQYCNKKVITIKILKEDLNGMLINYDLNDYGEYSYMNNEFVESIVNCLPEYAMGQDPIPTNPIEIIPYLREAAKSVIKIKKIDMIKNYLDNNIPCDNWNDDSLKIYNSKGIFSELILHFLLRQFKNTLPLVSKIYFKDSFSNEAHGFDAVHVTSDGRLWLGETKFYNDGKRGIKALIDDLNCHFNHDYLKEQFVIINRALVHNNELREYWVSALNNATRLEEKFNMIIIPLLCVYEDEITTEIINALNNKIDSNTLYFEHISKLKKYFDTNNTFANRENVQILLILLPIESKDIIVKKLLSKIYSLQNI